MYTGSCLCQGIRFTINAALAPLQICHCSACRKAQGSAFAVNTPVNVADFHLLCGADLLREFESSPGKVRSFCQRCGSPLFSKKAALPGVLRIRAGLIDEPHPARPAAHCFAGCRASWWEIDDELPRFAGACQQPR